MRRPFHDLAEKGRVISPARPSEYGDPYGDFIVTGPAGFVLQIIACDDEETGFEHVSVSVRSRDNPSANAGRCPTWEEMCYVKKLFWSDDECVVQYHPAAADYVNRHAYVLHLWKPLADFPKPPTILV